LNLTLNKLHYFLTYQNHELRKSDAVIDIEFSTHKLRREQTKQYIVSTFAVVLLLYLQNCSSSDDDYV